MSLIIIEGPRKSGKSFLTTSQNILPVFKFDFLSPYQEFNFRNDLPETHYFGLGKELMVHQLNKEGYLDDFLMDRGIVSNAVWGILQGRITYPQAIKELEWCISKGLFDRCCFVGITGTSPNERKKDLWDSEDSKIPQEASLFEAIYSFLESKGIIIIRIENKFNENSIDEFNKILERCAEY